MGSSGRGNDSGTEMFSMSLAGVSGPPSLYLFMRVFTSQIVAIMPAII